MDANRNQFAMAMFALLTSSLAFYFGTGLHPIWWLTWLAPIPVLVAAPRIRPLTAFLIALFAWAAGELNMWNYFHVQLNIPTGVVLPMILMAALVFAVDVMVYYRFLRSSLWRAALVFPAIWVTFEFVGARLSPHSTFGNISYSQMDFLPVLQTASITGIWGISFCLFLFAGTAGALLSGYGDARSKRILATATAAILVAVLGFGAWRLYITPPVTQSVTVGLLASDMPGNILTEEHADTLRLMSQYADMARHLAARGAKVIVIPEKTSVFLDSDLPEYDSLFRTTASQTGALIVVGVIHPSQGKKWNEARLYSPDGTIRTYEKHHMLPSFESSFTVGASRTEWQEPSGRWGVEICKDMDFPRLSRQYGNDGTALLLVPAWDFTSDGWLHGRMAILRGVESGFSIARAPKEGIMTVTDDRGRVLAERNTKSAQFAALLATVPVRHDTTIYARFGDWFGWLNLALLAVLLASTLAAPQQPLA